MSQASAVDYVGFPHPAPQAQKPSLNVVAVQPKAHPYSYAREAKVGHEHPWYRVFEEDECYPSLTYDALIADEVALTREISETIRRQFCANGILSVRHQLEMLAPVYPRNTVHFVARVFRVDTQKNLVHIDVRGQVNGKLVLRAEWAIEPERREE